MNNIDIYALVATIILNLGLFGLIAYAIYITKTWWPLLFLVFIMSIKVG